jgi:hypothetical protein
MGFYLCFHISWPISVKFGIEGLNVTLLGRYEFYQYGCSESHTLLKKINKHLRIFYIYSYYRIWAEIDIKSVSVIQLNICKFRENCLRKLRFSVRGINSRHFGSKQDGQSDCNVRVWRVRRAVVATNANILSIHIVVTHVYVSQKYRSVSVATKTEEQVPFALFSSYRIVHNAVNKSNH